jgi:lipoate-protein ligase A
MMDTWRLILDGDCSGATNMARDIALLQAVSSGQSSPVLRLYGWSPACLSLGKHQTPEVADLEFCHRNGIDVVRRPTGGRAVLHHLELTYAVVAPLGVGSLPSSVRRAYVSICQALVNACAELNIEAELTGDELTAVLPAPTSAIPCFKAPAGGEVVIGSQKLIGSAVRSHSGSILQHGSILLDWDSRLQAGSMGLEDDSSLRPFVTTFRDQLRETPSRPDLERVFAQAFQQSFDVEYESSEVSAVELAAARQQQDEVVIQLVDSSG